MGKGQHAINELCCSKEVRTETQLPVFKVYSQLSQTAEQTFLHLSGQARLLGLLITRSPPRSTQPKPPIPYPTLSQ
eukprot:COSAG01_NODE_60111_length_296_cov_1.045685_1_plen_75_part_10